MLVRWHASAAQQDFHQGVCFTVGTIEVVVVGLTLDPEAVCDLELLLSDAERQRSYRFAFDRDRRRYIVTRAWLRRLLAERLGLRPESVELTYGIYGKPALAPGSAPLDLRFNLSHSEDVAVFAFVCGHEVGIDVETIRTIRDADDIAAGLFSRRENAAYLVLGPRDRSLGFLNCWTRKEAFVKATGSGLHYPLDRFDVSLAPDEPARLLRVDNVSGEDCNWELHGFTPRPGMVGAVVLQRFPLSS